ncbi:hypothetical protein [Tenacibaculum crassostreae]|uniref:hypothetical protein n=1 Tax=Tenacibaculum crassostreae TaxID=502683 RepID=UPI003893D541
MKKTNLLRLLFLAFVMSFAVSCEKHQCKCEHDDWQSQLPEGTFCYSDLGRTNEMLNYPEIVEMLRNYDTTRIAPLEKALGYPDSRINTYNYQNFKNYLGHIESLSKKAKIEITGISFISAAKPDYNGTGKSYQDLIYIPTTTIDGKQVAFDPVQSTKKGKLVTFKEALAANGYNWIYNSKEEFEEGKRVDYNYSIKVLKENKAGFMSLTPPGDDDSGAGNKGNLEPPYGKD